jgi:hypothetical protein
LQGAQVAGSVQGFLALIWCAASELQSPQRELYRALTMMAHYHAKDLAGGAARHENSRQY